MNRKILYSVEEVQQMIAADSVLLVDVRDAEFFEEAHIQGAVNIPEIFYFLSSSSTEGLRELQETFGAHFSNAGIQNNSMIIFYEDSLTKRYCGSCRGYWLSLYLGHNQAGILYGGLDRWSSLGLPVGTGKVTPAPSHFEVRPTSALLATKEDVIKALDDPSVKLLDDRDQEEWDGESSSPYGVDFAPRKGRIPGAKWIEWREFMVDKKGYPAFRTPEEIRSMCAQQELYPEDEIILYCFKGARASNTYVALQLAGFQHVRIYFASWNEWSRDPGLPIESV